MTKFGVFSDKLDIFSDHPVQHAALGQLVSLTAVDERGLPTPSTDANTAAATTATNGPHCPSLPMATTKSGDEFISLSTKARIKNPATVILKIRDHLNFTTLDPTQVTKVIFKDTRLQKEDKVNTYIKVRPDQNKQ